MNNIAVSLFHFHRYNMIFIAFVFFTFKTANAITTIVVTAWTKEIGNKYKTKIDKNLKNNEKEKRKGYPRKNNNISK